MQTAPIPVAVHCWLVSPAPVCCWYPDDSAPMISRACPMVALAMRGGGS